MPKKDVEPPSGNSLGDILVVGKVRNPQDPLKGLVGARITISIPQTKQSKQKGSSDE